MSAATFVEATIVVEARRAWRRFLRGRHPAGLNYGNCLPYALAAARNEPLLFKDDNFAKPDVQCC